MGEISFSYSVKTESQYEAAFKYWFSESIEYSFAYQRYIAFSDASIFNSPVAITKVATGLYQYYDLFLDRKAHAVTYDLIKSLDDITLYDAESYEDESMRDSQSNISKFNKISEAINKTDKNSIIIGFNKEKWLSKYFLLNIYSNFIARNIYRNGLDIYSKMYSFSRDVIFKINDSGVFSTVFDSTLSIYDVFFSAISPYCNLNVFNNYIYGKIPDNKAGKLKNVFTKDSLINNTNISDVYFGKRKDLISNKIYQLLLVKQPEKYSTNTYNVASASVPSKQIVLTNDIFGNRDNRYIAINDFVQGYTYGKVLNCFSNISILRPYGDNIVPNIFSEIKKALRTQPESFYNKQYLMHSHIKPLYSFDIDTFTVSEEKYYFTVNGLTATVKPNYLQPERIYQCFKEDKNAFETKNIQVDNSEKILLLSKHVMVDKNNHALQYSLNGLKCYFAFKSNHLLSYINKPVIVINESSDIHNLYTQYFIKKDNKDAGYFNNVFIGKFKKGLKVYNDQIQIEQDKTSMVIHKDILFAYKDRKSFSFDDNLFISRDSLSTDMETLNFTSVSKDRKSIVLENGILQTIKDKHSIYLFSDLWIFKDDDSNHDMSILNQYFVSKKAHFAHIYRQMQSIVKSKIIVSAPDFETVIKNHLPADYVNTLHNNHSGMIIPISKVRHQGYIDGIDLTVSKLSKDGYLHNDVFSSVIPKDARIELTELFCDKKEFKAYINYRNIHITKSKVHAMINGKNIFVDKIPYSSNYRDIENYVWIDKIPVDTWTEKQIIIQKQVVDVYLDSMTNATTNIKYTHIYDSLFMDKNSQMCYYDYGMTWADNELKARINSQLSTTKKAQRDALMIDCVSPFIRDELNAFYDYGIFSNRVIQESDLYRQIHDVHKKVCDTNIRPEDFGNWAWVYETPDPFEGPSFTIDELLLPENDTRYEDFEDIIFDKKNMRPRNPVKVVNDTTFIAKYPIKHPLPKYSDVAVDYDKGAIKMENFYGIETRIMHTVFLKFYRIWQSKIFEFGTMTMVQSVNLMLEYMYSWIMEYFPVDEIEQALRVFKLIRWYGETSIIQNSQYIVTYEYGTLESKLNTGTCLIPNDLDTNDTMYIDVRLGVIRNNPSYINTNTGAYVTFEVDNKKNTTFTFSLSNTVGSVNIYINDVLVDTVSRSALNLTYELPYTGEPNIVKIEKIASHNLNGNFYIGNIKIPNTTFKDLSIEFDPTLKAGNKPLNEIAKKMIYFANLHEDREEAYEFIRKGNLGVGEIYKRLMEYWEIHHKGKNKGKRLTIKEV